MSHFSTLGTVLFQQNADDAAAAGLFGGVGGLVSLVFAVLLIAGIWKVFSKAGKPGWASIIPVYNIYVLLEIVGRPGWWLLLFFIPFVNIVIAIIVNIDLAKSFGKSVLVWGILLLTIFSVIGYILLGFAHQRIKGQLPKHDDNHNVGPVASTRLQSHLAQQPMSVPSPLQYLARCTPTPFR